MKKKSISLILIAGLTFGIVFSGCIEGIEEERVEEPRVPTKERIALTPTVLIISPHPDDGEIFVGGAQSKNLVMVNYFLGGNN